MKTLVPYAALLTLACSLGAEVVDRLALSVNKEIITEQQILKALRTTAFLNGDPLVVNGKAKRDTAQKLLELTLIRLEIELSRYPLPTAEQLQNALAGVKRQRFGADENRYQTALREYNISEADLLESFSSQLATLSFIEFRFRPAVQITEEEIVEYYRYDFSVEFAQKEPQKKLPAYLEVRAALEEILTQQRIDNLLDRWISQAENQSRVRWIEEVFSEGKTP